MDQEASGKGTITNTSSPIKRRRQSTSTKTSKVDTTQSTKSTQKHNIVKEVLLSFLSILGAILVIYVCLYLHYHRGNDSKTFSRISRNSRYH